MLGKDPMTLRNSAMALPTSATAMARVGPSFLTADDVAELTRGSVRVVRELTAKRAIPHRKMPGIRRVLYPLDEILAWLDGAQLEVIEREGCRIVRARDPGSREAVG